MILPDYKVFTMMINKKYLYLIIQRIKQYELSNVHS
jgi:hypothetical protein